MMSIK